MLTYAGPTLLTPRMRAVACFTGTQVQILTQNALLGAQFAYFAGKQVQILTQKEACPTLVTPLARAQQGAYLLY